MWVRVASAMSLFWLLAGGVWAQDACHTLAITKVEYLGVDLFGANRKDKVRVSISSSPSCLRPVRIRTEVSVTRPGGHVDSGFHEFASVIPPSFFSDVPVERGALERDPVSFSATVKALEFKPTVHPSTTADSTGATILRFDQNLGCCPKVDVLSVRENPRTLPGPNTTATVSWSVNLGPSSSTCFQQTGTSVSVKVKHTNGTCSGQKSIDSPTATSATVTTTCPVELPEAIGPVTQIEATVTPALAGKSGFVVSAQKSGNF